MRRKKCTCVCLCLTCCTLFLGIGGILVGVFGNAWWIFDTRGVQNGDIHEIGLLRYKYFLQNGTTKEGFFNDLFEFKDSSHSVQSINGEQRDTLVLLFLVSALFAAITFLPLCCGSCRMSDGSWECSLFIVSFLTGLSVISSLAALIYIEIRLKGLWSNTSTRKKSWSYISCWIGTGFLVLSSIFSFMLICMHPREVYNVNTVTKVRREQSWSKTHIPAKANLAFDETEINIVSRRPTHTTPTRLVASNTKLESTT